MFELTFSVEHKLLGVPYRRDEADKSSHGYVDLRVEPEKIDLIPEAADWPALKEMLVFLNDRERPFKSLGCAAWEYPIPAGGLYSQTYVEFCFADVRDCSDVGNYFGLFFSLTQFVQGREMPDDLVIKAEMRRTVFYDDADGWCLTFWMVGLGDDRDARRRAPEAGFALLREFLPKINLAPRPTV